MARQIMHIREEGLADGVNMMAIGKGAVVPRIFEEAELDITQL